MRSILCLVLLVTASGAQLLTDDTNDVQFSTADGQAVEGVAPLIDLNSLDAVDGDAIALKMNFENLQIESAPFGILAWTKFQFKDMEYLAVGEFGAVYSRMPGLYHREVGASVWSLSYYGVEVIIVEGLDGYIQFTLEKADVLDRFGRGVREGDKLENFMMSVEDLSGRKQLVGGTSSTAPIGRFRDVAPDSGESLALVMGEVAGAPAVDVVTEKSRQFSNGEPGLFAFYSSMIVYKELEAVRLRVLDGPEGWAIEPSQSLFEVPVGGEVSFATIIGIEGRHDHGTTHDVTMVVESIEGTKLATFVLQIQFTPVPLPAGHHDTLWIHTLQEDSSIFGVNGKGNQLEPFMNTIELDDRDTQNAIAPTTKQGANDLHRYVWCIPLGNAMHLGLDFEENLGDFNFEFTSDLAIESTLSGRLMLYRSEVGFTEQGFCRSRDAKQLAVLGEVPIAVGQDEVIEVEGSIVASINRLPPVGGSMVLELELAENLLSQTSLDSIRMLPGAKITLPLIDYVENIELPSALDILAIETEKTKRPGQVATFDLTIETPGDYQVSASNNATISRTQVSGGQAFQVSSVMGFSDSHVLVKIEGEISGIIVLTLRSDETCSCESDEVQIDETEKASAPFALLVVALVGLVFKKK